MFLLGSRYCETDQLSEVAWNLFGKTPPGWARVQAICDFVHNHIAFGYEHARATQTAWEAFHERGGVCRDYAHLAVAFCRCMNIPARYCTGYLGDIGMPPPYGPMDFAAWFEAYLGGRWYTFDAAQQHAAHRPGADRARPRRRRRGDQHHLRAQHLGELQGMDRRGARRLTPLASRPAAQVARYSHVFDPACPVSFPKSGAAFLKLRNSGGRSLNAVAPARRSTRIPHRPPLHGDTRSRSLPSLRP